MKKTALFILACMLISACSSKTQKSNSHNDTVNNFEKANKSFVVSCGSGCTMSYNLESIVDLSNTSKKIKFKVNTYIDNSISETSEEIYLFYYNEFNKIEKIQIQGENENILENLPPDAAESFRNFANSLTNNQADVNPKTKADEDKLLYNSKINTKSVKYHKLNLNSIKGISKYICDVDNPRYIPLVVNRDIEIILVPQDCGDFSYRFYLLTIKNKAVISDLYVEGEWQEPDDEESKETTSFTLSKDYEIEVKTVGMQKTLVENFKINREGKIIKKK